MPIICAFLMCHAQLRTAKKYEIWFMAYNSLVNQVDISCNKKQKLEDKVQQVLSEGYKQKM